MIDLIIKNGIVIDGSGTQGIKTNIAIDNGIDITIVNRIIDVSINIVVSPAGAYPVSYTHLTLPTSDLV